MILGIDTGGTFTDFVFYDGSALRIHKVLSTPQAPAEAILTGIADLGLDNADTLASLYIVHGSTVATNAVLEKKGVRTAYITNRGLADILTIGRQTRKSLYELQPVAEPPPVPRELCIETGGRIAADASVVEPLTDEDLSLLQQSLKQLNPEAVAINLLFSYLDKKFEQAIAEVIPKQIFVSCSSTILPEYQEYERGITTWLNAYVGPIVQRYLQKLCEKLNRAKLSVMQSAGGTIAARQAGEQAVHMLLSGPAGGLAGAQFIGQQLNIKQLLTFDMGGTSTDVALIDGEPVLTTEGQISGYPVGIPMLDMHTIGAGGGSIAYVDEGGLLQVGPSSAGADPGPACYGRGGNLPTVTDANLALGRLCSEAFLGGAMQLDERAAQQALQQVAVQLNLSVQATAEGIIRIANESMARALRVMSVQRGVDPRNLSLASFGGAGGLHVCALAEALGMHTAIIPVYAGVLSALGMLVAPRTRRLSRTVNVLLSSVGSELLTTYFKPLQTQGHAELIEEGVAAEEIKTQYSLDLRYVGQSYFLNITWQGFETATQQFHDLHLKRYGHQLDLPVELVNVRVVLSSQAEPLDLKNVTKKKSCVHKMTNIYGIDTPVPVYSRETLSEAQTFDGPALIIEDVATSFVAPGWCCSVMSKGILKLDYRG